MKRVVNLPLQARRSDAPDEARDLLFQDCEHIRRRLQLSDEDLAEVLDDLVEWYGGRPVGAGRHPKHGKAVRT